MVTDVRSRLGISDEQLAEFCKRWKITKLELFGSVLREDFREDSDIDLLVTFEQDARWSLLDHIGMEQELEDSLARDVDLVTRRSVEDSPNWIRRKHILKNATPIYER